jgi:hypothetical protein
MNDDVKFTLTADKLLKLMIAVDAMAGLSGYPSLSVADESEYYQYGWKKALEFMLSNQSILEALSNG